MPSVLLLRALPHRGAAVHAAHVGTGATVAVGAVARADVVAAVAVAGAVVGAEGGSMCDANLSSHTLQSKNTQKHRQTENRKRQNKRSSFLVSIKEFAENTGDAEPHGGRLFAAGLVVDDRGGADRLSGTRSSGSD